MIGFLVWTLANQSFEIGVLIPAILAGLFVAIAMAAVAVALRRTAFAVGAGAVAPVRRRLLRGALPQRAAVQHEPRVRPLARRSILQPLHANRHDGRRDHLRPHRPDVHRMDLLGLPPPPRTHRLRRHPRPPSRSSKRNSRANGGPAPAAAERAKAMRQPQADAPERIDRRLARESRAARTQFAVAGGLGVVSAAVIVAQAVLLAHIIAASAMRHVSLGALRGSIIALVVVVAARALLDGRVRAVGGASAPCR